MMTDPRRVSIPCPDGLPGCAVAHFDYFEFCDMCQGQNTEWIDIDGVPYVYCNDCQDY